MKNRQGLQADLLSRSLTTTRISDVELSNDPIIRKLLEDLDIQDPQERAAIWKYLSVEKNNFDKTASAKLKTSVSEILPVVSIDQAQLLAPQLESRRTENIDLAKVIDLALRQNLQIGIAQQNIQISKWGFVGSLGRFLPSTSIGISEGGVKLIPNNTARPDVKTANMAMFARFDYPLFQGGSVLAGSIAARSTFEASKGQFAAIRNDTLLSAVSSYYSLLSNQAILVIRLESARFSARQAFLYRCLFLSKVAEAGATLQELTKGLDGLKSQRIPFRQETVKDIRAQMFEISKLDKENGLLKPLSLEFDEATRMLDGQSQLNEKIADKAFFLTGVMRLIMSNEYGKLYQASTAGAFNELSENSFTSSNPSARIAMATRYKEINKLLGSAPPVSAKKEHRAISSSVSSSARSNAAIPQFFDLVKLVTDARTAQSKANRFADQPDGELQKRIRPIEQIERNLGLLKVDLEVNQKNLREVCASEMSSPSTPELQATIENKLTQLEIALDRAIVTLNAEAERAQGQLHSNHLNNGSSSSSYYEAQMLAFQCISEALSAGTDLRNHVRSIAEAKQLKLDKAKKVLAYFVTIVEEIDSLKKLIAEQLAKDREISLKLDLLVANLQRLKSTKATFLFSERLKLLRMASSALVADSSFLLQNLNQVVIKVKKAQDTITQESGLAFQLDQWNTQLATDINDLITQIITTKTSSINLSTLLNLDPRVGLIAADDLIGEKARDLGNLAFVDLVSQAISSRPELYRFEELRKAAVANIYVAAASMLPRFAIFGQLRAADGAARSISNLHLDQTYSIGFEGTYAFTNLLVPNAATVAAQNATALLRYLEFRQQLVSILQQVHTSYINVLSIKMQMAASRQAAIKATEQLVKADNPEDRARASASNLDVITALRDRNASMIRLAGNLATYNTSQAQLLHDVGDIYPVSNLLQ